jgi:hypothetical protein
MSDLRERVLDRIEDCSEGQALRAIIEAHNTGDCPDCRIPHLDEIRHRTAKAIGEAFDLPEGIEFECAKSACPITIAARELLGIA